MSFTDHSVAYFSNKLENNINDGNITISETRLKQSSELNLKSILICGLLVEEAVISFEFYFYGCAMSI